MDNTFGTIVGLLLMYFSVFWTMSLGNYCDLFPVYFSLCQNVRCICHIFVVVCFYLFLSFILDS